MYDVNPLGPLAHLEEIERRALAFRAATVKGRPGALNTASAWVTRLLKRLSISLAGEHANADNSMNVERR